MNKKLLVLAASAYQIPTISAAQEKGYQVITADNNPSNPGHALADKFFVIDTTDIPNILGMATTENIAGIISPGTDVAVFTAAKVAEELNLNGPPCKAAEILTSKYLFRKFLSTSHLACPQIFDLNEKSISALNKRFFQKKWIIKPNKSSGSKGIFIISNLSEFNNRYAESLSFSLDKSVILEEFIEGSQHTCEGFFVNGKIILSLVTDRLTAPAPYVVTRGHVVPCCLSDYEIQEVLKTIELIFHDLRITDGPFDCDFIYTSSGPFILEITPRLGGNSLSKLFKRSLKIDLINYAIRYACNDPLPTFNVLNASPAAVLLLGVEEKGYIFWDSEKEQLLKSKEWLELKFDVKRGEKVKPFINGRHRIGEAIIQADNHDQLLDRISIVQSYLKIKPSATLQRFRMPKKTSELL